MHSVWIVEVYQCLPVQKTQLKCKFSLWVNNIPKYKFFNHCYVLKADRSSFDYRNLVQKVLTINIFITKFCVLCYFLSASKMTHNLVRNSRNIFIICLYINLDLIIITGLCDKLSKINPLNRILNRNKYMNTNK